MDRETDIGESILHFGAFVEAETADQFVAQSAAAEDLFKGARLEVGAVFDGAGQVWVVVLDFLQFAGYKFGFGLRIARFKILYVAAWAVLGAEDFAEGLGIVGDDGACGVEDVLRGAIVAL